MLVEPLAGDPGRGLMWNEVANSDQAIGISNLCADSCSAGMHKGAAEHAAQPLQVIKWGLVDSTKA